MYAVIETGGKQYKISKGDNLLVEKLEGADNTRINFDKVLLIVDGDKILVGNPYIEGSSVIGNILSQEKGKKIHVSKFKAKVRYRRVTGHRQLLTRVSIDEIKVSSVKAPAKRPLSKKTSIENKN